jgi:hypothetical protein
MEGELGSFGFGKIDEGKTGSVFEAPPGTEPAFLTQCYGDPKMELSLDVPAGLPIIVTLFFADYE